MTLVRPTILLLALTQMSPPVFVNITESAGIRWTHPNGETPKHLLVESTTGGVGFLDFDNDGLLDIIFIAGGETSHCALYHNLGHGKFEDVSMKAGITSLPFYGMGVAAADYDNDGFSDLYITGFPSGALFHNNRNGTFTDVTEKAEVRNSGAWGASAAWLDYDRDGRLDLFVANYVEFSYSDPKHCEFAGQPAYCAQTEYQGSPPRLYHNNGDGTFTDVSVASGIAALTGRALGVVAVDSDGDGWVDLFVARDASPNLLLINQHDGTFRDKGIEKEIAYNVDGVARSGMGVDAADINSDGLPDFVVTNFDQEYHALYLSDAKGGPYIDATRSSGLARLTQPFVGWGVRFLDFDNDGAPGLLIANGHLHQQIALANTQVSYREPPLLLKNNGKGKFENIGVRAGKVFQTGLLGRGLATGDFDNDGAIDAVIVDLNGPPVLLRNSGARQNAWIGVALRGRRSNRDAIGARLTLHTSHGVFTSWVTGGASFMSSHDRRVVFGLGSARSSGSLEIRWPNGATQSVSNLKLNSYSLIEEPGASQQ
ncbi:MAG: CRTAC1 family protein [Acidobacteriota bacterium]|nr:CRTAC1 family protein [Acidobacteriota bacterium]